MSERRCTLSRVKFPFDFEPEEEEEEEEEAEEEEDEELDCSFGATRSIVLACWSVAILVCRLSSLSIISFLVEATSSHATNELPTESHG